MSSAIRPPRTRVIMFFPRFAGPIAAGTAAQTIRGPRYRDRVRRGDLLSLRVWTGKPYRSPTVEIVPPVRCTSVSPVALFVEDPPLHLSVRVGGVGGDWLDAREVEAFARSDGFASAAEMSDFYRATNTYGFRGFLIEWEAIP